MSDEAPADIPEAPGDAEEEEQIPEEGEEQPGGTEEEGDEAAVEEALGALDSVHEEADAQGDEAGEDEERNAEAEVAEGTSQRSSPVSERSQDRLSVPASQRSKASQRASNLGAGTDKGSERSGRSQKGSPTGSAQGRLSKATVGSIRSKQSATGTSIKDEDFRSVLFKAFPVEKNVVMNNAVQLADIDCLLGLLEDTEMDSVELQDLKEQAETLKEENAVGLQNLISLRSKIEECAMTSGIATSDEKFLQLKLLKMQGKTRKGTPSGHNQERVPSRTSIGSKSGKGSRQGHDHNPEDNRSNSEKQRQDELIKQLAQRNNDLSQKVHELERFVETSLKEAKLKINESSKHDKLVSQLFKENAQLAVSLESSEQTRRMHEKELTVIREKHAAMVDLLKKTLLVSVDKK